MILRVKHRNRDSDARAVRRSARVFVGRLTAVTAGLVSLVVLGTVFYIVRQSHPREELDALHPSADRIFVDSTDLLAAVIVIGALAVVLAAVASWVIARSAVRPLGTALKLQREFVADASHELRTPLSVLDARLQLLERRPPSDPHDLKAAIGVLRRDTRALIDVVVDLLLVAEAGAVDLETSVAPVDVGRVMAETAAAMALVADSRGVGIEQHADGAAWVQVPEVQMRRMVTALVDNAIAHSPAGGSVRISAVVQQRRVVIQVTDEGPGIRGIAPERVFERFARSSHQIGERVADGTTAADTGQDQRPIRRGFGIGLALVRDVAVRHGGSVSVRDTSSRGTTMRLERPRADPPA